MGLERMIGACFAASDAAEKMRQRLARKYGGLDPKSDVKDSVVTQVIAGLAQIRGLLFPEGFEITADSTNDVNELLVEISRAGSYRDLFSGLDALCPLLQKISESRSIYWTNMIAVQLTANTQNRSEEAILTSIGADMSRGWPARNILYLTGIGSTVSGVPSREELRSARVRQLVEGLKCDLKEIQAALNAQVILSKSGSGGFTGSHLTSGAAAGGMATYKVGRVRVAGTGITGLESIPTKVPIPSTFSLVNKGDAAAWRDVYEFEIDLSAASTYYHGVWKISCNVGSFAQATTVAADSELLAITEPTVAPSWKLLSVAYSTPNGGSVSHTYSNTSNSSTLHFAFPVNFAAGNNNTVTVRLAKTSQATADAEFTNDTFTWHAEPECYALDPTRVLAESISERRFLTNEPISTIMGNGYMNSGSFPLSLAGTLQCSGNYKSIILARTINDYLSNGNGVQFEQYYNAVFGAISGVEQAVTPALWTQYSGFSREQFLNLLSKLVADLYSVACCCSSMTVGGILQTKYFGAISVY